MDVPERIAEIEIGIPDKDVRTLLKGAFSVFWAIDSDILCLDAV